MPSRSVLALVASLCLALPVLATPASSDDCAADEICGETPPGLEPSFADEDVFLGYVHAADDPAPRVRERARDDTPAPGPIPATTAAASARAPYCVNDASQLDYTRVIYARAPDYAYWGSSYSFATIAAALREQVAIANGYVHEAGLAGGASVDMRFLCTNGQVDVTYVQLPTSGWSASLSFDSIVSDFYDRGEWARNPRVKYMIFYDDPYVEGSGVAGRGHIHLDATPGSTNRNNGHALGYGVSYARISASTMLHEWGHNMGAVQPGAPESSGTGYHCNDGLDIMCYGDGGSTSDYRTSACGALVWDCGKDTYFNVAPGSGSYLAKSWNIGSKANRFLKFYAPRPVASFTGPSTMFVGDTATFTSTSQHAATVAWFVQGSQRATGPTFKFTPTAPGTHTISLRATNADGIEKWTEKEVVATEPTGTASGKLTWQSVPLRDIPLTFTSASRTITTTTNDDGAFATSLPVGTWTLDAELGDTPFALNAPVTTKVTKNGKHVLKTVVTSGSGAVKLVAPANLLGVSTFDLNVRSADGETVATCAWERDDGITCDADAVGQMLLVTPGSYVLSTMGDRMETTSVTVQVKANTATTATLKADPWDGALAPQVRATPGLEEYRVELWQDDALVDECWFQVEEGVQCEVLAVVDDLPIVPAGTYTVKVSADSFQSIVRNGVTVVGGKATSVPLTFTPTFATLDVRHKTAGVGEYRVTLLQGSAVRESCLVSADGMDAECDVGLLRASGAAHKLILPDASGASYAVRIEPAGAREAGAPPVTLKAQPFAAAKTVVATVKLVPNTVTVTITSKVKAGVDVALAVSGDDVAADFEGTTNAKGSVTFSWVPVRGATTAQVDATKDDATGSASDVPLKAGATTIKVALA